MRTYVPRHAFWETNTNFDSIQTPSNHPARAKVCEYVFAFLLQVHRNKKINVRKILAFFDLFRTDGNVRFFHFF